MEANADNVLTVDRAEACPASCLAEGFNPTTVFVERLLTLVMVVALFATVAYTLLTLFIKTGWLVTAARATTTNATATATTTAPRANVWAAAAPPPRDRCADAWRQAAPFFVWLKMRVVITLLPLAWEVAVLRGIVRACVGAATVFADVLFGVELPLGLVFCIDNMVGLVALAWAADVWNVSVSETVASTPMTVRTVARKTLGFAAACAELAAGVLLLVASCLRRMFLFASSAARWTYLAVACGLRKVFLLASSGVRWMYEKLAQACTAAEEWNVRARLVALDRTWHVRRRLVCAYGFSMRCSGVMMCLCGRLRDGGLWLLRQAVVEVVGGVFLIVVDLLLKTGSGTVRILTTWINAIAVREGGAMARMYCVFRQFFFSGTVFCDVFKKRTVIFRSKKYCFCCMKTNTLKYLMANNNKNRALKY